MKLCKCNMCGNIFEDTNPKPTAKEYPDSYAFPSLNTGNDGFTHCCPMCLTDGYLVDAEDVLNFEEYLQTKLDADGKAYYYVWPRPLFNIGIRADDVIIFPTGPLPYRHDHFTQKFYILYEGVWMETSIIDWAFINPALKNSLPTKRKRKSVGKIPLHSKISLIANPSFPFSLTEFLFHPVKNSTDEDGNKIIAQCTTQEAQAWAIFAILTNNVGERQREWIADTDSEKTAKELINLIKTLHNATSGKWAL